MLDTQQPTEKAYNLSGYIKNGAENEITVTLHKSKASLHLECSAMATKLNINTNEVRNTETDSKNYYTAIISCITT